MGLEGNPFLPSAASSARRGRNPGICGQERFSQNRETWGKGTAPQNLSGGEPRVPHNHPSHFVSATARPCGCGRPVRAAAPSLQDGLAFQTERNFSLHRAWAARGAEGERGPQTRGQNGGRLARPARVRPFGFARGFGTALNTGSLLLGESRGTRGVFTSPFAGKKRGAFRQRFWWGFFFFFSIF